jgi:sterol desaturase/sphingolipid hydroxylase (fatty acid hydroxylase superfamily)
VFGFTREIRETVEAWDGIYSAPSRHNRKKQGVAVLANGFLERTVGTSHPALPGVWFLPLISYGIWRGFTDPNASPMLTAGVLLGGVLLWTFIEYWLHRIVFHLAPPKNPTARFYWFMIHGYHHEFPNDRLRLVMPPLMSWPVAGLFAGIFWTIGGTYWFSAFTGVVTGYLAYDWIHYYTHHGRPKGRVGKFLRRYHMEHHFKDQETHFGLSSPLWDVVFRTFSAPTPPTDLEVSMTGRKD